MLQSESPWKLPLKTVWLIQAPLPTDFRYIVGELWTARFCLQPQSVRRPKPLDINLAVGVWRPGSRTAMVRRRAVVLGNRPQKCVPLPSPFSTPCPAVRSQLPRSCLCTGAKTNKGGHCLPPLFALRADGQVAPGFDICSQVPAFLSSYHDGLPPSSSGSQDAA